MKVNVTVSIVATVANCSDVRTIEHSVESYLSLGMLAGRYLLIAIARKGGRTPYKDWFETVLNAPEPIAARLCATHSRCLYGF